jgi:hypothetical protein
LGKDGGRRNMMRTTAVLLCGTALLMGLLTGTANATPTTDGCPSGYEPATYGDLLLTPEVIAADRDNVYHADHVADVVRMLDQNNDGLVCYKPVADDENTHYMVYYAGRYVDNHAGPEK